MSVVLRLFEVCFESLFEGCFEGCFEVVLKF